MKYNHIYGLDIEESMTHYDIVFTKIESVEEDSGIQGGLHNAAGKTMITIIRKGAFVFDLSQGVTYSSYLAEKLSIDRTSAKYIRDWIIDLMK